MKKNLLLILAALGSCACSFASAGPSAAAIQRLAHPQRPGTALSVQAADGPLMFTAPVFATDLSRDVGGQAEQALDHLQDLLVKAGGNLNQVLRLNVYVADENAAAVIDGVLARRFADAPPAVTLVTSPLARRGALVVFDAVAAVPRPVATVELVGNSAAIMPAGGKVFVSGQAEPAPDLATATRLTMESLHRGLAHLGLAKTDVVQVKAFIQPFADHAVVTAEVAKTFAPAPMPPLVLVEWHSTLPTEIELVAAAPALAHPSGETLAFPPLPGMSTSPRFSRVATVAAGTPLIFLAGFDGGATGTLAEQWKRIFEQLGGTLFDAGSSFRQLVKATYYLADAKGTAPLAAIRAVYFDPTRPPAASAVRVTSVGRPQRTLVLDMIAVPAK